MQIRELQDERVLVVGYGVTGASVARFLKQEQISFDIADECDAARARHIADEVGCHVVNRFDTELFSHYSILVLSPGIPRSTRAIAEAVAAGATVVGDIELFAGVVDVPVIAVTGSNGKSTVVSWIASTLQSAGINALACGNIGQPALDSIRLNAELLVLELSSYQLESTYSLRPLSATVLNISDDHLDRYDSLEHYAATKRTVLDHAQHRVVNRDDPRTWPTNAEQENCTGFTLAVDESAPAVRWHRSYKQNQYWLCDDQSTLLAQSDLRLPGDHNAANALAVLALIEPLAVPFADLKDGLLGFAGLPHRGEYLGEQGGVRWYNDSKGTNVDACAKAITAMPGPVLLIAGGIAKGADFKPLRETVRTHVRLLVLIGRDRERIKAHLDGTTDMVLAEDLTQAVTICQRQAKPGDVVLLSPACASFDMFKNFEDRGEQFSAAVEQVLAA